MPLIGVNGNAVEDLAKISKAFREAENGKTLRKTFNARLNEEAKVFQAEVREDIAANFPKGGGGKPSKSLFAIYKATRVQPKVVFGGKRAGVRMSVNKGKTGGKRRDIARINRTGQVRHPTFGHAPWATQTVAPKKFVDEDFEQLKPRFRKAVLDSMEAVKKEILRKS